MEKRVRRRSEPLFDSIKHVDDQGNEYWLGRELGAVLEYSSYEAFLEVINRAKLSVANTGIAVENHFRDIPKMVSIGYGNERNIGDVRITRYGCYIIAQNGSAARKPKIAAAQAYFALQTRKQELAERHDSDIKRLIARHEFTESDKRLSGAVLEKGVHPRGLAQIKQEGDKSMFGGKSTDEMKRAYGIVNKRIPWANRAPNVVLAAKSLANEMTATNLEDYAIDSYPQIMDENKGNNTEVRKALLERGIIPEEMPPEEDTDKIMRRVAAEDKRKALEE
ncbi:DNA damage-inducible protein D [Candidatus Saccharibacteria bacterium]|nr:DNA damage-inducible protein D [Candidatus Saccharibacteria bacterium]